MQGEILDGCRIRKSMWDGPFAMSYAVTNTTTNYQVPPGTASGGPPYAIVINNGTTPINVTMYTPVPATGIMWCHEIISMATGAGAITIKGASSGNPTIGTLPVGKRAEVVWNPFQATPDWNVFLSA